MEMFGSLLSLSLLIVGSYGLRSFVDPVVFASSHADIPPQPQYTWTEYYYQHMPIDHFAYADSRTFALRYLMNLDNYKPGGPIFFYTGNEGPIDGFANNTGLVWDLSSYFNAAVVFAEHRFYGKTLPFGDQSYTKLSNLGYLSSEQALADYAILIGYLKKGVGAGTVSSATNAPVIAFGGSYGGMLAAWFRIKYPHVVIGALSSSAPVLQFEGTGVDQGVFERIIKQTFVNSGCNADNFPKAWQAIDNLASNADGRAFLNHVFKLAPASQITQRADGDGLIYFIREAIEYMAMVDYPYPSNFLKPMPGWPVQVACQWLSGPMTDDRALATAMYNLANLYYNYTGSVTTGFCLPFINSSCSDAATSALSSPLGWPWQACTEMVMPICAQGPPNDLFWKECGSGWTPNMAYDGCTFFNYLGYTRAMLRPDWIITNYGGNFAAASNIIFSNGMLDPWSGGGVTSSSPGVAQAHANGVYTFLISQSGHHLDLRQPNSCDPQSVRQARYAEVNIMWCWAYPNDAKCQPITTSTTTTTTTASTSSSSTTTAPSTTSTSTTTTPTTTTSTTTSTSTSTTTSTSTSTITTTPTTTTPAPCNYEQNGYPWGQTGSGTPSPPSTTADTTPSTTTTSLPPITTSPSTPAPAPTSITTSTPSPTQSPTTSTPNPTTTPLPAPTTTLSTPAPTATSTPPPSTTTASKGSLGLTPLLGLVLSAFFVIIIRF